MASIPDFGTFFSRFLAARTRIEYPYCARISDKKSMKRKIIIYGASGGIGSALARALAKRDTDLHLAGRDRNKVEELANELKTGYTVGDVNDEDYFARVSEDAGEKVAGLIYAVGTINLRNLRQFKTADFLADFRVNALGAALAVQAALPALKKSDAGSAILLFSSVAAGQGFPFHTSMGMAKGAVSGLTLSLAAELAPGIRVNAIAPSLTETPLAAGLLNNKKNADAIAALHPLRRLGKPEDIAETGAFLMSQQAEWITGQIIHVDGGRSSLRTGG
jgi:NAD(P)-dependent dehydrogenase (short-subunit alcohol dehydrogenase family)